MQVGECFQNSLTDYITKQYTTEKIYYTDMQVVFSIDKFRYLPKGPIHNYEKLYKYVCSQNFDEDVYIYTNANIQIYYMSTNITKLQEFCDVINKIN
jgi:hypothetical protein